MTTVTQTIALLVAVALTTACAPQDDVSVPPDETPPSAPDVDSSPPDDPDPARPPGPRHNPAEGLFEIIDLEDPIRVGDQQTYVIDVTNQGSAPDSALVVRVTLPPEQSFVSAQGHAEVQHAVDGRVITFQPVAQLAAGARATYKIVTKARAAGDVTVTAELTSDNSVVPLRTTESTHQQ